MNYDVQVKPNFLRTSEVATLLGMSASKIKRLVKDGLLNPSKKTRSNQNLFVGSDISAYLEKNPLSRDAIVFSFMNIKGGVGKTTEAIFFALVLSFYGFKVLVVDLDKQSNASRYFLGEFPSPGEPSVVNIFDDDKDDNHLIKEGKFGVDILNSSLPLYKWAYRTDFLPSVLDDYFIKYELLKKYHFIINDMPTSYDDPVKAALVSSDFLLIPIRPKEDSLYGYSQLKSLLSRTNKSFKQRHLTQLLGVIVIMTVNKAMPVIYREFEKILGSEFLEEAFKTPVPESKQYERVIDQGVFHLLDSRSNLPLKYRSALKRLVLETFTRLNTMLSERS